MRKMRSRGKRKRRKRGGVEGEGEGAAAAVTHLAASGRAPGRAPLPRGVCMQAREERAAHVVSIAKYDLILYQRYDMARKQDATQ